jgi:hypothetical protein
MELNSGTEWAILEGHNENGAVLKLWHESNPRYAISVKVCSHKPSTQIMNKINSRLNDFPWNIQLLLSVFYIPIYSS